MKELKAPSLTGGKCSADVGRRCKQSPPRSPPRRSAEAVCLWLQQHCYHGATSRLPAEDSLGGEIRTRVWKLFESWFWPDVFPQTLGPKQSENGKMFIVIRQCSCPRQAPQTDWMSINVPQMQKLVLKKVELNFVPLPDSRPLGQCFLFCLVYGVKHSNKIAKNLHQVM